MSAGIPRWAHQSITNRAIPASPAPPGTRLGFTESIETSAWSSVVTSSGVVTLSCPKEISYCATGFPACVVLPRGAGLRPVLEHHHLRPVTVDCGEGTIARHQRRIERFGKRNVRRIVSREVVAQLPYPRQQDTMWVASEGKVCVILD